MPKGAKAVQRWLVGSRTPCTTRLLDSTSPGLFKIVWFTMQVINTHHYLASGLTPIRLGSFQTNAKSRANARNVSKFTKLSLPFFVLLERGWVWDNLVPRPFSKITEGHEYEARIYASTLIFTSQYSNVRITYVRILGVTAWSSNSLDKSLFSKIYIAGERHEKRIDQIMTIHCTNLKWSR